MDTAVSRLEQDITAQIDLIRIGAGNRNGRRPIESVLEFGRGQLLDAFKIRPYPARQSRLAVELRDVTILRVRVNQVRRTRRGHSVLAVPAGHRPPVKAGDAAAAQTVGWPAPGIVVLQAAAQKVGRVIVGGYGVKLLDGQIVQVAPVFSGV